MPVKRLNTVNFEYFVYILNSDTGTYNSCRTSRLSGSEQTIRGAPAGNRDKNGLNLTSLNIILRSPSEHDINAEH